jgi:tRNA-2-methylthio-N6-dimethylallyladenosine synthase
MARRYHIETMGCQMNVHDSELMAAMLEEDGWRPARSRSEADLIILNTCSIREKAEQKVYSALGRLAALKRRRPELVIAAGGCVAQQAGESLLAHTPHLDLVFGTHQVANLTELLAEVERGRRPCELALGYQFAEVERPSGVKTFVSIMQGCDNFCAYCIVPYVRGREVSRPQEAVVREVRGLVARGVREVTLLGQNVNSYGKRMAGEGEAGGFVGLLRALAGIPGLERLRFTTSHPRDLSAELAALFGRLGVLCEHIHLPVQSGSTRVLAMMRRGYSRRDYLERVAWLRRCPEIAITTDLIVGFPGETEDDFAATLDLVREVGFEGSFSFKYSDRPGTLASRLPGKLTEAVKAERLERLLTLQEEITQGKNRLLAGSVQEVLVEGRSKRGATLTGRTRCHRIVHFAGPPSLIGGLVRVRVEAAYSHSLKGRLIEEPRPAGIARRSAGKEEICIAG